MHGYDWDTLGQGATVVDIGGSDGHVNMSLAQAHPDLRFIVLDTREVVELAATRTPAGVGDNRLLFEPYGDTARTAQNAILTEDALVYPRRRSPDPHTRLPSGLRSIARERLAARD